MQRGERPLELLLVPQSSELESILIGLPSLPSTDLRIAKDELRRETYARIFLVHVCHTVCTESKRMDSEGRIPAVTGEGRQTYLSKYGLIVSAPSPFSLLPGTLTEAIHSLDNVNR